MAGIDDWLAAACAADADDVRERILTGYKDGKPFTPYVPTILLPRDLDRVLDFGCGLGRNFPYLTSIATRVSGFDLPPMIARCRELAPVRIEVLTDDWADLCRSRFDLVYASLVLQHIEPDAIRAYLRDFARMAPAVYLLTRIDSDFGENVLGVVHDSGLFEGSDCALVEHEPATHQLRVLGRGAFDQVRRSATAGHCEVLLRSRERAADAVTAGPATDPCRS